MNWIQRLRKCFESNSIFYTRHSKFEMEQEKFGRIFEHEIYEAIFNGEVIEEYPDDKPYPSVLIYGKTMRESPLHIVCAYNKEDDIGIIITVYHPDPDLWIEYKRRKKL